MFSWLENRIDEFRLPEDAKPPSGLWAFYWHFTRQVFWPWIAIVMVVGCVAALIEVYLFVFVGELVDLLKVADPKTVFQDNGATLLWMGFIVLIARPVANAIHFMVSDHLIAVKFNSLIRWQAHRYVLRQSFEFFQNDFAGRIANKVMQTPPSLRQTVMELTDAIWFVLIYAVSAIVIFAQSDIRMAAPIVVWMVLYGFAISYFVPRIKTLSTIQSEARSTLTGRIVDSYTNIMTVKLFAHAEREDDFAREAITDHTQKLMAMVRMQSVMNMVLYGINGLLLFSTGFLAVWLWQAGTLTLGALAVAMGLAIRIINMAGWIMWVITSIFENIGTVAEGMETISKPYAINDRPDATPLQISDGRIVFDEISFHYGTQGSVIDGLQLAVEPGEKIGLVGPSGAGKSTLVNLLLRLYDLETGKIVIDGQDIAAVQQESLRAQIGMVTQDTSLLHRSIRDNIKYGLPGASDEDVLRAAALAKADEFIPGLEDVKGRKGLDAHVGERGVKLSGGQRQRIAIARVLLKDAPILIMDEATSALDSEAEAVIQEQLHNLMEGKTVIAIAHRLSTIASLDRLVVMDKGKIVEQGTHDALVSSGGTYSRLWARQSGGFLAIDGAAA